MISKRARAGSDEQDALSALENRDVLFVIFSFLDLRSLLRAMCVSHAWKRVASSEPVWMDMHRRCGVARVASEPTWRQSFLLSSSKWREWRLREMAVDLRRMATLPLSALKTSGDGNSAGVVMKEIEEAGKVFRIGVEGSASRLVKHLPNITLEKDTGFVPGSKGFLNSETVIRLSPKHSLIRFYFTHDQYSGPRIDMCTGLSDGHPLTHERGGEVLSWVGRSLETTYYPLRWNKFDSPSEQSDHNIQQLMLELGLEGRSINWMLSGLSEIGTSIGEYFYESEEQEIDLLMSD